jgi:malate dehydrogenase (quinone)
MTVPHLDTRYIDGERTLLFGPFASVGPKFLDKSVEILYGLIDLNKSKFEPFFKNLGPTLANGPIKPYNISTLLSAAVKNLPLIKYSFDQILMTKEGCILYTFTSSI